MTADRNRVARVATSMLGALAVATALLVPSVGGPSVGAATVPRPEGVGPPVPASGIGTQAALDNPRCRTGAKYGPYGRFDSTQVGAGPVCVKAWKAGADNGGATAQGVTKDKITIVAVILNDQQFKTDPVKPTVRATKEPSTYQDAIHDLLYPQLRFFETWGRDLEIKFYTSSGDDEAAQRADLVAVKAMKPFAVVMLAQPPATAGNVFESGIAQAKIPIVGYTGSPADANAQSPYRWMSADFQAPALNSAEVLGKQLVGKKAEFGGDAVKDQTRKLGVVYIDGTGGIDYPQFEKTLTKYGGKDGKVATKVSFSATQVTDPTQYQTAAATFMAKMKDSGVTTVVPFVLYQQFGALAEAASKLDYFPEWFFPGMGYFDLPILTRSFPVEQTKHAFGISFLPPPVEPDQAFADQIDPLNWYWGLDAGSTNARIATPFIWWVLAGIHTAGPNLTPKTFKQGLFSIPTVGPDEARSFSTLLPFGKTAKLPYDEYALSGYTFWPIWYDPEKNLQSTNALVNGTGNPGYVTKDVQGFRATEWPTKQFAWFDKSQSVYQYLEPPTPPAPYAGDCKNCPSTGGPGQTGAESDSSIIVPRSAKATAGG